MICQILEYGVSQGTILGSTLFNKYINSLFKTEIYFLNLKNDDNKPLSIILDNTIYLAASPSVCDCQSFNLEILCKIMQLRLQNS